MPLDALTAGAGQTDQRDARHAIGGLLAVTGASALDVRTGVLAAPGSTQLLTGTSKTGPKMSVRIGVHVAVTSRGAANGPYLGPTLEAPLDVDIELAPASGARLDVVYVKQRDTTSGVPTPDATPGPLYGVVTGTPSTGTPAKPSLSGIVGAEEIGTVRVAAGATSTSGAGVTITNTARQTVARGARVPVRSQAEQEALTAFPGLEVYRLDTGQVQLCTATQPVTWATRFDPAISGRWVDEVVTANTYDWGFPADYTTLAQMSATVTVPAGRTLDVEWKAPRVTCPPGGGLSLQLLIGGAQQDVQEVSTDATSAIYVSGRLTGSVVGTGAAVPIAVQGKAAAGTQSWVRGGGLGPVRLRYRIS